MKRYEDMADAELEAEIHALMERRAELRAHAREITKIQTERRLQAALAADIKKLREKHGEKRIALSPEGVLSAASVGVPGG